ncbi:MAG TPA: hypothetical protein VGT44_09355 [Ktedonobacteraceae bacterium]|nr:hypothetical protein [Ktedonobacteraceae bacterium]
MIITTDDRGDGQHRPYPRITASHADWPRVGAMLAIAWFPRAIAWSSSN